MRSALMPAFVKRLQWKSFLSTVLSPMVISLHPLFFAHSHPRSSSIAVKLATKHLSETGLLALSGAMPCLDGTPGMMGYGMAKAAVHQLTKSLAVPEKAGLPAATVALTILPVMIDHIELMMVFMKS